MRRVAWGLCLALLSTSFWTVGPPAHAAFPGANGRIVFDSAFLFNGGGSSQIYSVRPDGGDLRQLTDMPEGSSAWQPHVSADGRTIVFVVSTDGETDRLWLMRSDGTHERALTDEPGWSQGGAAFTAGGGRILYSRCGFYVGSFYTCHIVSVRRDGTGPRTVIGGTWHPSEAAVSPGGSTVAFVSDQGGYDPRLWLVDADGTDRRTIGPTFGLERLSWAPDGSHIAFTAFRRGAIFTIAADGRHLTEIVPRGIFPAWSPDGRWVAYLNDRTGDLKRARPDGSHVMTIVSADTVPGIGYSDWGVAQ